MKLIKETEIFTLLVRDVDRGAGGRRVPNALPGCCNPGYLQLAERELVSASSVLECLENPHHAHDLEGVTFLGGESMLQAQGLAVVAQGAQSMGLSVMIFSGYTKNELDKLQLPGTDQLLLYTDGQHLQTCRDLECTALHTSGAAWAARVNLSLVVMLGILETSKTLLCATIGILLAPT